MGLSTSSFMVEGQRQYASWDGCVRWIQGDGLNTDAAITEAGLDWTVSMRPVGYGPALADSETAVPDGAVFTAIPDQYACVRSDTGAVLGRAGLSRVYKPVQNRDAFDFGSEVLGGPDAPWVSGGSYDALGLVYMQARLHRDILIGGDPDERIDPLLTVFNYHGGTGAFGANVTPVRVVCENTCRMAVGKAERSFRMRHTTGLDGRLEEARRTLGLAAAYFTAFEAEANRLLKRKLTGPALGRLLEDVFPIDPKTTAAMLADGYRPDRSTQNTLAKRDAVRDLLNTKPDLQNITGTAWGALQAIADWNDHHRGGSPDNTFYRIVFADGKRADSPVDRAYAILTA